MHITPIIVLPTEKEHRQILDKGRKKKQKYIDVNNFIVYMRLINELHSIHLE